MSTPGFSFTRVISVVRDVTYTDIMRTYADSYRISGYYAHVRYKFYYALQEPGYKARAYEPRKAGRRSVFHRRVGTSSGP